MTDLDYQRRFSKNQNIPERHIILLQTALRISWRVYMTNYWPKDLDPRKYTPEDRTVIKISEHFKQLEARVAKLEAKK